MTASRWAAATFALTLAAVLAGGCQNKNKPAEATSDATMASPEKISAAKASYAAQGMLVGEVDAVKENMAAVSGIDPAAITKQDVLNFIDVDARKVINHGTLVETKPSGRIIVECDRNGDRLPHQGDLVVKLK
jgi:hypothetical protein